MFQEKVQKRLNLFITGTNQPVEISDQSFHLIEKDESGKADLQIDLSAPCILFRDLENKKLQYFKNQKCADYVMFEKVEDTWCIHIFEFKRTVTPQKWEDIKLQFAGALQNALALEGVLDVDVKLEQVRLYTVYRNDKIRDAANPAKQRLQMHDRQSETSSTKDQDWNQQMVAIDFPGIVPLEHHKIPLNVEDGTGIYELSS